MEIFYASKSYGVNLKTSAYDAETNPDAITNNITTLIEDSLTSHEPALGDSPAYTSIVLGSSDDALYNGTITYDNSSITYDNSSISYYVVGDKSSSGRYEKNIADTDDDTEVPSNANYTNITTNGYYDIYGAYKYGQYNGGALSLYSESEDTTLSINEITGSFIGNSITADNYNIYQANGGAIALFSNKSGASITVGKIHGDFIGNSAGRVGGAIYLFTNNGATVYVEAIDGSFIDNGAVGGGGAIANYEGEIGAITGDFIGNTTDAGGGGAIDNMVWSNAGGHTATITSIYGNFIGNTAGTGSYIASGGAIQNYAYSYGTTTTETGAATIANIIGNFIGNSATGDGGAIYNYAYSKYTGDTDLNPDTVNMAIISTITGNFIGNSAAGSGGAIYNADAASSIALVGIITGDFFYNTAGVYGGAIYNTSQIDYINGNFVNNSAGTFGGAVYNRADGVAASIGNITGNFIGNSVTSTASLGGAIFNYSAVVGATATIGDIEGDFIANSATKYGGAIYNDSNSVDDAVIGDITGNFLYNCVAALSTTTGNVNGGAIYNNAIIGDIEGSFIGNYVIGNAASDDDEGNTVAGGAIYTTADMSFIATNQTNYFSDNYIAYYAGTTANVNNITDLDYNAIYVGIDTITDDADDGDICLTFTMSGDGNFVMNDSIIGVTSYTLLDVETFNTIDVDKFNVTSSIDSDSGTNTAVVSFDYNNTGDEDTTTTTSVSGWTSKVVATTTTTYVNTVTDEVKDEDGTVLSTTATTTTTTTVATSTTSYTGSNDTKGTTTTSYLSTITTVDSDGNTTIVTNTANEAGELTGDKDSESTTTTTTYTITGNTTGESASYTTVGDDDTVTTAKTVVVGTDGKTVTTTYTANADDDASTDLVGVSTADSTQKMTGSKAFDMKIVGDAKGDNTFYLTDEITYFGELSITNATLYLSSYLHADGETTTYGGLTALDSDSSVTFGENSVLTIDMSAYPDSMTTDGSVSETAVLTGKSDIATTDSGASLYIDSTSKLNLINVSSGTTFTILSGFKVNDVENIQEDADGNPVAWKLENVSIDSDLFTPVIARDGYNDTVDEVVDNPVDDSDDDDYTLADRNSISLPTVSGDTGYEDDVDGTSSTSDVAYVISFEVNTDSVLIKDSSISEIVCNAASDSKFSADSDIAGERYLYDISTMTNDNEELAAVEGTVSLAKIAGVSTTTYRVNRLASDALSSRLSMMGDTDTVLASYGSATSGQDEGIGRLSQKEKSVALWFVPMYGHDRVSGASVAGFGADFVTNIYGGVAGVDKTIESNGDNLFGADLYRVGLAVHAGMGDTSTSGTFNNINNDFYYGGAFVYGVAEYGDFTLSADIGVSKIISEVQQDLSQYGLAGTEADVYSHAWSFDVRGEYCIKADDFNIIPYLGLEFVSMKTEDYDLKRSDAAGGTAFTIVNDRQNIISVPVGLQLNTHMITDNGWNVKPQLSVGAILAMGDLDEYSTITMPGVAGSGHTSMEVVDEITLDLAAGLSIAKDEWTFGLDYTFQQSEHRTGHGLVGLIQYKF